MESEEKAKAQCWVSLPSLLGIRSGSVELSYLLSRSPRRLRKVGGGWGMLSVYGYLEDGGEGKGWGMLSVYGYLCDGGEGG